LQFTYPPYDLIILSGLTFLSGFLFKNWFLKKRSHHKKFNKIIPYTLAYFPVSLAFAFITNELPLKLYGPNEIVYDPDRSGGLGPQNVSLEGLKSAGIYLFSVALNLLVWGFCLFLIARYLIRARQSAKQRS